MNDLANGAQHEDLSLLLPWYVNGTLSEDERIAVQEHLADCEECRDSLALLADMQEAARNEPSSPIVPQPRLEALLGAVDAQETKDLRRSWIKPRAAAALVGVVMLGIFFAVLKPEQGPDTPLFKTATSDSGRDPMDYVLVIEFTPEVAASRRGDVLDSIGGTIIGDGNVPQSVRVAVSLPVATLDELDRFTGQLEAEPDIVSVRVVAVQIPVE